MDQCPLCYLESNLDTKIILENKHCLFIQNTQKVLIGSGLIIPKKHRDNVFDLTKEEWIATYDLLKEAKKYLDNIYSPDGYNVGWNVGRVGGQEIFHVHLHIIPRFKDEPLAGKGIRYWLKQKDNMRS